MVSVLADQLETAKKLVRKETQITKEYLHKTTSFNKNQLLYQIRYKNVYSKKNAGGPGCIWADKEQGEHHES